MKLLFTLLAGLVTSFALSACGECACNSYNPEYLRDIPVSTSRSFN